MRIHVPFSLLLCWLLCSQLCSARHTLKAGEEETSLVSASQKFELGFISLPDGSDKKYLGIWYRGREPQTVVWVANRDHPVEDSTSSPVFKIAQDGNLVIVAASESYYNFSGLEGSSSSTNRTAQLLDSGNLVLMENNGSESSYRWQSFENPTDTFLPGMKMDEKLILTSWRSSLEPGRGNFTFKRNHDGKFVVIKDSELYWRLDDGVGSETSMPPVVLNLLANSSHNNNKVLNFEDTPSSRLVMNFNGEIQFLKWDEIHWDNQWYGPANKCDIHNFCGYFMTCNENNFPRCKCLPGFSSMSDNDQCERKSASCANKDMMFLNLTNIKLDNPDQRSSTETEGECQSLCLNMCHHSQIQCQAYSYNKSFYRTDDYSCEIWTRYLPFLKEDQDGGRQLSILVNTSDIVPTPKSCQPCGTYSIPYPLSTGLDCGDPMYYRFNCTPHTGHLSFMMPQGKSYQVTWINPPARNFLIRIPDSNYCDGSSSSPNGTGTNTYPFNVTDWCVKSDEIEITWQPAPEPPCSKPIDCHQWSHSTCRPTIQGQTRCLCDSNYRWNYSTITCTKEEAPSRLALILIVILIGTTVLACIIVFAVVRRRKIAYRLDRANTVIQESLCDSERHVKGLIGLGSLEEKDIEGVEVPCYTFASILAATDNFSDSNRLGQGGYGPVYKGRFPGGQHIAVKRLSTVSTQGLEEFKNEVVLIAKLQHRNLVRLRGYCIKGHEKILLYEYMPNKSLDSFIFDRTRTLLLDWPRRFDIIVGIARGLLYLHQDSRLRVIHRDMKTSNILLDEDMEPKISDFGLAKIFGGKETEASTQRVVGTFGYMAPEYALDGFYSIKSDVFSFGVVVLEILSGKKNTGFYQSKQIGSLLGYAWKLWTETKLADLMEPSLRETCNENQFIKCALIGLLCVQDEPGDRPTMSFVLTMLDSDTRTIPIPTQPTFFVNKCLSSSASSSSKPGASLQFESSYQEGR
ncbi:hypothetical protein VNO77_28582 [Canavalia gladiata]|uniref:non-specific serine/threonine protein kinase n=1 Tax=Canavalia gladiata TaxID=3824 RepID=A0AAN9L0H0_CANGL